jgi:hypothetical protein
VIAAVRGSGEPGVALIGVASAEISSAGDRTDGLSGRFRHKRTVMATVHESGEPGVALLSVAGAEISSVGGRTDGVNTTGCGAELLPNGRKWRNEHWSPTAEVSRAT